MKSLLLLEDGSTFEGISIGTSGERIGEVVLHTAVVGYQEIMTDPTNAGKILILTYPLIGNYGVAAKFNESRKCWIEALVIKEKSKTRSNWQSEDTFDNFLKKERVVGMNEVDTRTLTAMIRDKGQMLGIISSKRAKKSELMKRLKTHKNGKKRNFIKTISTKNITRTEENPSGPKIGVLDLGILNGFLKQLSTLECDITLLPYNTGADKILGMDFDGLVISNGPEEDEAVPEIARVVKHLLGKIPLLGIGTGHQIIGLALGGRLKKMKVGHHGVNYPVRSPHSFKGEITVQNHSSVINEKSISNRDDIEITLRNVNDETIEEMESKSLKIISTQYYPASPGLGEVHGVFKRFLETTGKK